jgi:hypothetical protein
LGDLAIQPTTIVTPNHDQRYKQSTADKQMIILFNHAPMTMVV